MVSEILGLTLRVIDDNKYYDVALKLFHFGQHHVTNFWLRKNFRFLLTFFDLNILLALSWDRPHWTISVSLGRWTCYRSDAWTHRFCTGNNMSIGDAQLPWSQLLQSCRAGDNRDNARSIQLERKDPVVIPAGPYTLVSVVDGAMPSKTVNPSWISVNCD